MPAVIETAANSAAVWQVSGASVRGAAHLRRRLPNQDAIRWSASGNVAAPLVLAVADGHGSAKCFRSHIGARLAVMCAVRVVETAFGNQELIDPSDLSAIDCLTRRIVAEWRSAVSRDLWLFPFEEQELALAMQSAGADVRRALARRPSLAYGSTLSVAAVTESYGLYLQLGDGDTLSVSPDSHVTRPVPEDPRLFADQTTSLCMDDAAGNVRVGLQRWGAESPPPALILISTDGYANSFKDDQGFLRVGSDLLSLLQEEGLPAVETNLESWLEEASRLGSGDDVTLGLLYRSSVPLSSFPVAQPLLASVLGVGR
ncbi:MAG TPA: PP2C family serine/threonine-protein phosphatase [Chloroflexota bacterium]|nr:PP2C family serine/threonine-protein phosphatase [Chloroflexota bacterium]